MSHQEYTKLHLFYFDKSQQRTTDWINVLFDRQLYERDGWRLLPWSCVGTCACVQFVYDDEDMWWWWAHAHTLEHTQTQARMHENELCSICHYERWTGLKLALECHLHRQQICEQIVFSWANQWAAILLRYLTLAYSPSVPQASNAQTKK